MKRGDVIRVVASGGALALLVSRLLFPAVVKADAITLALLVVAILPWLGDVFESIDFPGGGGVRFRETVKAAGEVVAASAPRERPRSPAPAREQPAPPAAAAPEPGPARAARHEPPRPSVLPLSADPNLALVALRIEIEKRLAALVEKAGVKARTLNDMLRSADDFRLLDAHVIDALRTLIRAGNMAAHGRPIDRELGEWVGDIGPDILRALDLQLQAPDLP